MGPHLSTIPLTLHTGLLGLHWMGLQGPAGAIVAAAPARRVDLSELLLIIGAGLAAIIVGGIVLLLVRQRLIARQQSDMPAGGLLDTLRSLRNEGKMTPEEYDRARRALIGKAGAASEASARAEPADSGAGAPGSPATSPGSPPRKSSAPKAAPEPGVLTAPPGVDLTGAPLPRPAAPAPRPDPPLRGTGAPPRTGSPNPPPKG